MRGAALLFWNCREVRPAGADAAEEGRGAGYCADLPAARAGAARESRLLLGALPNVVVLSGRNGRHFYCLRFRLRAHKGGGGALAEQLRSMGCKVSVADLARCDMAEAVEDAFRYSKLVLACMTYNGGIFPVMREFIQAIAERGYQKRTVALIENGSWAPMAAKTMRQMLEGCKELSFAEPVVSIRSAMDENSRSQLNALGKLLSKGE